MKKPIDPNLNNKNDDDFLSALTGENEKTADGGLYFENGAVDDRPPEPSFTVSVNGVKEDFSQRAPESTFDRIVEKPHEEYEHHHSHHHHHHEGEHHSHHSSHHSSHGHHSSHSHHRKKKKMPLALRIAICILLVIAIIIAGVFGFFAINVREGDFKGESIVSNQDDYEEVITYNGHKYKYNEDVIAVAFFGVDQETMETVDETDFVGAADADIVFAVDTKTGKASAIAIPRDTMVDVDVFTKSGTFVETKNTQLCLAYAYGDGAEQSCTNTVNAMSRILYNMPIQKYFALDLGGISVLNDAIGGVTLESKYDFTDLGIKKGDTVTLKGDMAEAYVRTRDLDNINASLNRTERQIQYVKEYSKQLAPAVMNDFGVVSKLYNAAKAYSQTDLALDNVTYLASLLLSKNITTFDTYSIKGEMSAAPVSEFKDVVHAQFTPDEESVMETVLSVFYTQVD